MAKKDLQQSIKDFSNAEWRSKCENDLDAAWDIIEKQFSDLKKQQNKLSQRIHQVIQVRKEKE